MSNEEVTIYTDQLENKIRLTPERQAHVLEHPEMESQLDRIREILSNPDAVVTSAADETVHVYHKQYDRTPVTRKYLLVAVKMLAEDAFVLTAFFSSRLKRGKVIWQK